MNDLPKKNLPAFWEYLKRRFCFFRTFPGGGKEKGKKKNMKQNK